MPNYNYKTYESPIPAQPEVRQEKHSHPKLIIILILIGVVALVVGIAEQDSNFFIQRKMLGINPDSFNPAATGTKVICYDVNENSFTNKYIIHDMIAYSADEVGYIVLIKRDKESAIAYYGGSIYHNMRSVTGKVETCTLTLRDYQTGKTIAEKALKAEPPSNIKSTETRFNSSLSYSEIQDCMNSLLSEIS